MKLTTLKPRVATLKADRLTVAPIRYVTPRLRGKAAVERRERWLKDHGLCVHCETQGRTTIAREVDHVTPLWAGGADDESNFQSLCVPCHAVKTEREATERAKGGGDSRKIRA